MAPHPSYPRTRLYVTQDLRESAVLALEGPQAHHLLQVLRAKPGDGVALFNGRDGEWLAVIAAAGKKAATLEVREPLRPQPADADIWLLAAPLKGGRSEWVVEKATELGASRICPVLTRFTVVDRVNEAKFASIAQESAQQCERMSLPTIAPLTPLEQVLKDWPGDRQLIFGDESGAAGNAQDVLSELAASSCISQRSELPLPPGEGWGEGPVALTGRAAPHLTPLPEGEEIPGTSNSSASRKRHKPGYAVLIGPEGGFSKDELALLRSLSHATGISMGPRVLRADTAAVAALTLIQMFCGDWEGKPDFRS